MPAIAAGLGLLLMAATAWLRWIRPHGGLKALRANRKAGLPDLHGHRWDDLPKMTKDWVEMMPLVLVSTSALIVGGLVAVAT